MSLIGQAARLLLPHIATVVAAAGAKERLRRLVVRAVAAAVAGFFFLLAFGFGLAAGYSALVPRVGAPEAALIIAGGLLLVGAFALLVGWMMSRKKQRSAAGFTGLPNFSAAPLIAPVMNLVRDNPKEVVLGAVLAGAVVSQMLSSSKSSKDT